MISAVAVLFSALVGFLLGALAVCAIWAISLTRKRVGGRDVPPPDKIVDSEGRRWARNG